MPNKSEELLMIVGSHFLLIPNSESILSDHSRLSMFINMVREALELSVTMLLKPVSFAMSQVSIVLRTRSSPAALTES